MSATRYASVHGLGFGDCGKGHFIDALTRRWQAHTIVRCNGGAQAGHNVVLAGSRSSSGIHHTFSQFGAGTFVPQVHTLLLNPMVVHPTAVLVEAERLTTLGMNDALLRLHIDARCLVTTPFHQAAGRLRELLRGANPHGTCGVGVGETVRYSLEHPYESLRYGDLLPDTRSRATALLDQIEAIRRRLLTEFSERCTDGSPEAVSDDFRLLQDESVSAIWLAQARALARQSPPEALDQMSTRLTQPGCVLVEGAQGVLLDEWHGFHPHTTWSSIQTVAVEDAVRSLGISTSFEHYGVLRTYLTRHGAGPFPTEDIALDPLLPEPHNSPEGFQGKFRRGHPDAVLWRYAIGSVGPLSGLLLSHLDVFDRGVALKWCESYLVPSGVGHAQTVQHLPVAGTRDLAKQEELTRWLKTVTPRYKSTPVRSALEFRECLRTVTSLPVLLGSYGPTSNDVGPFG